MAKLRSTGMMVTLAVVGLGVIGAKLFWPETPEIKVVPKEALASKPKPKAKPEAAAPVELSEDADAPVAAAPAKPQAAPKAPAGAKTQGVASAKSTPTSTARASATPTPAAPQEEPVASRPATSSAIANKPAPAGAAQAVKPARPAATAANAAPAAPAAIPAEALGPTFVDEHYGYSMRFPAGWAIRSFPGEPWVLDCGDGRVALISVGFSPFPAGFTADNIPPEWVARRIKKRRDTVLHSQGYATISGRKALWSKSTGPLPMTHASPRMTRVNYIIPLTDGRVVEIRIATSPETFEQIYPLMRRSVGTFRLLPGSSETIALTE